MDEKREDGQDGTTAGATLPAANASTTATATAIDTRCSHRARAVGSAVITLGPAFVQPTVQRYGSELEEAWVAGLPSARSAVQAPKISSPRSHLAPRPKTRLWRIRWPCTVAQEGVMQRRRQMEEIVDHPNPPLGRFGRTRAGTCGGVMSLSEAQ